MRQGDRLLSVDVLRGVAALAVFVFHASVFAGFDRRVMPPLTVAGHTFAGLPSPFPLGGSGVNLFFVLSGFCLALGPLSKSSRLDLLAYARGRAARIVPVYWLTIAVSVAVYVGLSVPRTLPLWQDVALHAVFAHGLDQRAFLSLHGGLWSMATEVQFYLLFPLLLAALRRRSARWFVACVVIVTLGFRVLSAALPSGGPGFDASVLLAYQIPGRASEFALGMGLAAMYVHQSRRSTLPYWAAFAVAAPVAIWCRAFGPVVFADLGLGIAYALLVAALVFGPPREAGPVTLAAAAFGRASYSFFLIHWPVMALVDVALRAGRGPWEKLVVVGLVSLPLSTAAAALMYRTVELPLWERLRRSPNLGRNAVLEVKPKAAGGHVGDGAVAHVAGQRDD